MRDKLGKFMKGQSGSPKTQFKKGHSSPRKGKKYPQYSGKNSFAWKGGIIKDRGYVYIFKLNHPFAIKKGYIKRSRFIIEKRLGRYLKPKEIVHHINNIKNDDRPENLKLFANKSAHTKFHKKLL